MNNEISSAFAEKPGEVLSEAEVKQTPNAIKVDRWGTHVGHRLAEKWNKDPELVADAHAACFEPSAILNATCSDEVKRKWFAELLTNPEFQAIHRSTVMHSYLSEIGAKQISHRYETYLENLSDEDREKIEADREESIEGEMRRSGSVAEAVHLAADEVTEAVDAGTVFGLGASEPGTMDADKAVESFRRVRDNSKLREIAKHAGRFIDMAQSLQRSKAVHGMDDVVGVELSDNVSRLVPSELGQMTNELLELDFLRRLVEKQAVCFDYKTVTSLGKGPIMVLVDESSSMNDDNRLETAKGLALALAWLARHQNRWCALIGWSSSSRRNKLLLEPGTSTEQLMDWATVFLRGGTNPPVNDIPGLFNEMGAPEGRTDIIWITDGECAPSHSLFDEWRKDHECMVWTIGIDSEAETFHPFSDHVASVRELDSSKPIVSDILSL